MMRRTPSLGQAVAEIALVLPIFLIMLMVLFDIGRVIYAQNAITQDARGATRFGAVSAPRSDAEIKERARLFSPGVDFPNSAITGDVDAGGSFYPAGGSQVVVEIEVDVPILTPILSTIMGGNFTVTARSEEQIKS